MSAPNIKDYLIAAIIGNVPVIITVLCFTFVGHAELLDHLTTYQIVLFVVMFVSGFIGGYFIVLKFSSRPKALGLVTGALIYVINAIYAIVLYGRYMIIADYLSFPAFVVGGFTGAMLRNLYITRRVVPE